MQHTPEVHGDNLDVRIPSTHNPLALAQSLQQTVHLPPKFAFPGSLLFLVMKKAELA